MAEEDYILKARTAVLEIINETVPMNEDDWVLSEVYVIRTFTHLGNWAILLTTVPGFDEYYRVVIDKRKKETKIDVFGILGEPIVIPDE